MRKKLIELIRDGRYKAENICNKNNDCQSCTIADPNGNCKVGYIADHLIANDVVPVVRCKDCKCLHIKSFKTSQFCTLSGVPVDDDDFCSYGERRLENG